MHSGAGRSGDSLLRDVAATMAGRTFELLKSVNGIGSSTTSFYEQRIVNVVSLVVPSVHQ